MKAGMRFTVMASCILLLAFFIGGCAGSDVDLPTQISGKWKPEKGDQVIEVQLAKDPKALVIDGKSYPAVIQKINKDDYMVNLQVQTAEGKTEVWSLRQMWNDNGSAFKLSFGHGGVHEVLISTNQT
jgi:hypothetical protein